jgi:hypothetical protein
MGSESAVRCPSRLSVKRGISIAAIRELSRLVTSHHLRQLAKHGFIEEVPELARGRERWWRSARVDWRVPPREEQDPQGRALPDEIVRLDLAADIQACTFTRVPTSKH